MVVVVWGLLQLQPRDTLIAPHFVQLQAFFVSVVVFVFVMIKTMTLT